MKKGFRIVPVLLTVVLLMSAVATLIAAGGRENDREKESKPIYELHDGTFTFDDGTRITVIHASPSNILTVSGGPNKCEEALELKEEVVLQHIEASITNNFNNKGEKILAQAPQLKVVAELDKTQYQVGEKILVRPSLINTGEQPVTIFGGLPLLFFRVYDANNRPVGEKDVLDLLPSGGLSATVNPIIRLDILRTLPLSPGAAHVETWPEGYTFTLDQPGSYKVVAWAEFSLDQRPYYAANPLHIAAEPIWIEVVTGSN